MTLTKKNSKNKSNRLKADLFEVLVAIGLSKKYKLETNRLFHETEKLIETLSRLEDGKIRIREQEERALLALPYIVREVGDIRFAKNKTPIKVDWVGRSWQKKKLFIGRGFII